MSGRINAWAKLKHTDLLPSWLAAERLRISVETFRRMVNKLDIPYDGESENPHYLSGPKLKLYSKKRVASLGRRKSFIATKERAMMRIFKTITLLAQELREAEGGK